MNLTEFLLARIAEDEEAAREALGYHRDLYHPARVLAECQSKRGILAEHEPLTDDDDAMCGLCDGIHLWPCRTVRLLTLPYADHPDYDPTWSV